MNTKADKILFDLMESASQATASLQIFLALDGEMSREKIARDFPAFNDFFIPTMNAHLSAIFVELSIVFDKNKDASSLKSYFQEESEIPAAPMKVFRSKYDALVVQAKQLTEVRHGAFAHKNKNQSVDLIVRNAGTGKLYLEQLLANTCKLLREIKNTKGWPQGISDTRRHENCTLAMLDALSIATHANGRPPNKIFLNYPTH